MEAGARGNCFLSGETDNKIKPNKIIYHKLVKLKQALFSHDTCTISGQRRPGGRVIDPVRRLRPAPPVSAAVRLSSKLVPLFAGTRPAAAADNCVELLLRPIGEEKAAATAAAWS